MKSAFAILASLLCMASVATAQPASSGLPPVFKIVTSTDKTKGQIVLLETVAKAVPVDKVIRVITADGPELRKVTEFVIVYEKRTVVIDATKSRVITPDGKQLPIDEVWKRLKKNTVVAASDDGNTPAQEYLRALSAETLIVISSSHVAASPPIIVPARVVAPPPQPPLPQKAPPEPIAPPVPPKK